MPLIEQIVEHSLSECQTSAESLLSVVVPVFNEAEGLMECNRRISDVLVTLPMVMEIVYVNDGSTDESLNILERLRKADPRIAIVDLSRNFGKEIALSAGLDHASGDTVVIIDSDLQEIRRN